MRNVILYMHAVKCPEEVLSQKWEGIYTIKQGERCPSHNNQCAAQPSHHTACCSPDCLPVHIYLILQYPPWVQFPWKYGGEPDVVLGNSQAENQDEMLTQDLEADSIGQMILLFCRRQDKPCRREISMNHH